MKVLWLCNTMLPVIAEHLGQAASSKEGWLSGMADMVLADRSGSQIALSAAFPLQTAGRKAKGCLTQAHRRKTGCGDARGREIGWGDACGRKAGEEYENGKKEGAKDSDNEIDDFDTVICRGAVRVGDAVLDYYGFPEDMLHPEKYQESLEPVLKKIVDIVKPDIVHCFGTEYPHTLAMCRVFPDRSRLLVGLQGLCTLLAEAYYADLPRGVIASVTFRDRLKKDSIRQQRKKYADRGVMERAAVGLAGNITGRTAWDRANACMWNPEAGYYVMNESLRREFYGPVWREEQCIPHSVFVSQGDYPLKGLHYMLLAMPRLLAGYPDARVYVAGNSLVEYRTLKQKIKISAYGKYLRRLMRELKIEDKVIFLGMLSAEQMRDRCLKSSVFVCCSSLENSPNSLGEAMLLGAPCVSADVGGIPSMFEDGVDGILYEGFRMRKAEETGKNGNQGGRSERFEGSGRQGGEAEDADSGELERIAGNLAAAVMEMWSRPEKREEYCRNARAHALKTHDRENNYRRLVEIYGKIL